MTGTEKGKYSISRIQISEIQVSAANEGLGARGVKRGRGGGQRKTKEKKRKRSCRVDHIPCLVSRALESDSSSRLA